MSEAGRKVKIGCLLPLSGYEARHAKAQLLAIKLALEEGQQELNLPFDEGKGWGNGRALYQAIWRETHCLYGRSA